MAAQVDPHIAFRNSTSTVRGVLTAKTNEALTLIGTAVDVSAYWTAARVKVRQEYRSDYPISISAFAAFNVPEGWQVISFKSEVAAQAAYSQLKPKTSVEAGCAALRQEPRNTFFTANIPFAVHAGQSVLCTIIYLAPLEFPTADEARFSVPKELVAAATPQTTSEWKRSFVVPSSAKLPQRVQFNVEGTLYSCADQAPRCNLPAANTAKRTDPHDFSAALDLDDPSLALPSDITFTIPLVSEDDSVSAQVMADPSEHIPASDRYAVAVSLSPQFPTPEVVNTEVVIALDGSLSMLQHREQVMETVKALVAGLPTSCFFNVVTFGSEVQWLFPQGSEVYTGESVSVFNEYMDHYQPKDDVTRIYQAVRTMYAQPCIEGYARVVVLVTDGSEPKHSANIISIANANTHSTRVVSVGLGEVVDRPLLQAMAKVSNGRFCDGSSSAGGSLLGQVLSAMDAMLVPTLTQVDVRFLYDGVDEAPPVRPCFIYPSLVPKGERATFYALGDDTLRGCTCVVSGTAGGSHLEYKVHTGDITQATKVTSVASDAATASIPHQAAAANRIRILVDRNVNSTLSSAEIAEVSRLGCTFSLSTHLTNFQVTDGSNKALDPKANMVWAPFQYERQSFVLAAPEPTRNVAGFAVHQDSGKGTAVRAAHHSYQQAVSQQDKESPAAAAATSIMDLVVSSVCDRVSAGRIVCAQSVDGSWKSDDPAVLAAWGKASQELVAAKPADVSDNTWATAMIRTILEKRFSQTEACLAIRKAVTFLAQQGDAAAATAALPPLDE